MEFCQALEIWLQRAAADPLSRVRTDGWERTVDWRVDGITCRFKLGPDGVRREETRFGKADLRLELDRATLDELVEGRLHFFLALWGSGRIKFRGAFGDAYRLGYLLSRDRRARRVVFVAHCWLNVNTRFPGGGSHPGAVPPVVQALADSGVGIVQMPCPEFRCFGLEKYRFGFPDETRIRSCFREVALSVLQDVWAYQDLGYQVEAIIGMDPSPSCGVLRTKGKASLLGLGSDTSEAAGRGVFIEELHRLAEENGRPLPRVIGLRRVLSPDEGDPEGLEELRAVLA